MERDLVKRLKKDGSERISIYVDNYADNPRYNTDEPLHCEDWSHNYTIMTKQEREHKRSNARSRLEWAICNYADEKKVVKFLVANGKKDGEVLYDNRLWYNRSARRWELQMWYKPYGYDKVGWYTEDHFDCKRENIDFYTLVEILSDETIDYIVQHFMTDGVKMASYGFGYNGEISFYHEVSCDAEGIAWLEKDEFLKYSGCKEEYWNGKTLKEIEWLTDELEAWGNNEVYGFVVEECIKSKVHEEYVNVEKDDEDYEEEEWNETDSCWGFYGELDKNLDYILESAGFKKEELEEVA